MSSFPTHVENIECLKELGFDVDDCFKEDGSVSYESWGYDDLTYLIEHITDVLVKQNFKVDKGE